MLREFNFSVCLFISFLTLKVIHEWDHWHYRALSRIICSQKSRPVVLIMIRHAHSACVYHRHKFYSRARELCRGVFLAISETFHTYPMKFLMKQLTARSEQSLRKISGFIIGRADDISRLQLVLSFMPLSLKGAMLCCRYTLLQQLNTVAFILCASLTVCKEANEPKSIQLKKFSSTSLKKRKMCVSTISAL